MLDIATSVSHPGTDAGHRGMGTVVPDKGGKQAARQSDVSVEAGFTSSVDKD